ncbi:hypothetical protein GCM10023200_31230 [Actinomycetospora chlora]|uniref:Uncharacterized protein n=1 Tax=Actinomycetospora chlora TaxID=663608 RepID=A0ABP9BD26_9PSEU
MPIEVKVSATPAASGPAIDPSWVTVKSSVLAAGSWSFGRIRGRTAERVGWLIARNAVWIAKIVRTSHGLPSPVIAARPSSADVTAIPAPVITSSQRRSTASAIAPPHSPKTISGTRPNRPVRPTHADEPVSW